MGATDISGTPGFVGSTARKRKTKHKTEAVAEHDRVRLRAGHNVGPLCGGEEGTVIHCYAQWKAIEVEFRTIDGSTYSTMLPTSAVDCGEKAVRSTRAPLR